MQVSMNFQTKPSLNLLPGGEPIRRTSIEICAGAGGQAIGLEQAGFDHECVVEIDARACDTLRRNRPEWDVRHMDVRAFTAHEFNPDLLAGGVPCPPFSVAGKRLGSRDERDLFPEALRLVGECEPRAVMIENVKGLLDSEFNWYRDQISDQLRAMGYVPNWALLNASDFGVPQLRPRTLLVALRPDAAKHFAWPTGAPGSAPTVGEVLYQEMASAGWERAKDWAEQANTIAPTLVGGSTKHGGPDLGPTRARQAWAKLGVDGRRLDNQPPAPGYEGLPYLTVRMAALIQGFPPDWEFAGPKTATYKQVGNAFPPPVARAVGLAIRYALDADDAENAEVSADLESASA
jgi:DNA (cytosine-5)-methyltransferase 1